jgi:thiamine pyrophosphokinase
LAPFGQAVSEEKLFLTLANQKQELPLATIFVGGMGGNLDAFCQVWFHLAQLYRVKMISTARSNYPEILKKI